MLLLSLCANIVHKAIIGKAMMSFFVYACGTYMVLADLAGPMGQLGFWAIAIVASVMMMR